MYYLSVLDFSNGHITIVRLTEEESHLYDTLVHQEGDTDVLPCPRSYVETCGLHLKYGFSLHKSSWLLTKKLTLIYK